MAAPLNGKQWILTYTGRKFWPLAPDPAAVSLEDIAHALSNVCRFTGHVSRFYSVAEHSVRVSMVAEAIAEKAGADEEHRKMVARWGLMHDASEAYLADIASPIKHTPVFELYRQAEAALMLVITRACGLPDVEPDEVKQADGILLASEAKELIGVHPDWKLPFAPDPLHVGLGWSPQFAESQFLARYRALS